MLASVLRSKRAIEVNIAIMRAFVRLREMPATHKELAGKLLELEQRLEKHDDHIQTIFEAIRQMMEPPDKKTKRKSDTQQKKNKKLTAKGRKTVKNEGNQP
ncbi:MAG: hypothetical protein V3S16_09835 [Candidatus Desulfatibia sp.]|uniref:hypothetical protein n=1 Tax=Candidatus Desulfatibia sp. TaxID=3101189 RepID=UPI002F310E15